MAEEIKKMLDEKKLTEKDLADLGKAYLEEKDKEAPSEESEAEKESDAEAADSTDEKEEDTEEPEKPKAESEADKKKKAKENKDIDPLIVEFAESLKEQLGKGYDKELDKLPIAQRIITMRFLVKQQKTKSTNNPEAKIPKGKPNLTPIRPGGVNYKELGKKYT